ncbi:NAD(+)/NADH kinase [Sedimentibacter hydroxybenzoicus DSM 7310]|uniref:NAD(+)/NADH kinase n=1 Tax=Sedimentibacter hydroxybenzoicus DSM 7310 TaxID=1123245 RepID=A0A974GXS0_SEDHY|nr:NAD(+)/NADH kinase [Sedimentibacter hydroxybenzoicus]NYB75355.1 NAD(+)/NADH kinase [Sedimentibacter hydroxybenzoicus DSM 7310]
MISIGIIANPASGKDIRRLVSHATVIDNNEKINIVERIILGAQALGVGRVYMMPDSFNMGYRVEEKLNTCDELRCEINVIDMYRYDGIEDTLAAAEQMEKLNVGCIVVLGGDGTNRAVAKVVKNTPLISISTGTNNAYPVMMEGTIAGMAAAATANGSFDESFYIERDKRIEIYKNGVLEDIALIDAVISKETFVGSKAIWDMDSIDKIFVSRCHPASIGFSAIVGSRKIILPKDDYGACVDINNNNSKVFAAVAAGVVAPVSVSEPIILNLDDEYKYTTSFRGTIALDGEREIQFSEKQEFVFKVTRHGPRRINVKRALETAQNNGFFKTKNDSLI